MRHISEHRVSSEAKRRVAEAAFELAAVEAAHFEGSAVEGISFLGATCYGYTIRDGDPPPTQGPAV